MAEIVRKALSLAGATDRHQFRRGRLGHAGKILEKDTYAYSFDAQTSEFGNLMTKGIVDPSKVVRDVLQDGASIAGLLDHD